MDLPFKLCKILDSNEDESGYIRIASDNETLFLVSLDGKLRSVRPNSQVNWLIDLGGQVIEEPYIFNDNILILSKVSKVSEDRDFIVVRLLNKKNGIVKWKLEIDPQNLGGKDNKIYFNHKDNNLIIVVENGDLYLVDLSEGKITAENSLRSKLTAVPFFDEERIVIGTANKQIIQISSKTIKEISRMNVLEIPSIVYLLRNRLIYGDSKGKLTGLEVDLNSLNLITRQRWVLRVGGKISNLIPINNGFLIASLDNYIYSVSADSGEIIWKQRLANRPDFTPLVIENYVVVSTVGESPILIIELKSGQIINKINVSEENFLSGDMGKIFPFIYLPTNKGMLFYTSEAVCP